jgi:hypothetical protein
MHYFIFDLAGVYINEKKIEYICIIILRLVFVSLMVVLQIRLMVLGRKMKLLLKGMRISCHEFTGLWRILVNIIHINNSQSY